MMQNKQDYSFIFYQKHQNMQVLTILTIQEQFINSEFIIFFMIIDTKQDQIINTLKQVERVAEETKIVAANTNAKAYENGEQLQRIEGKLKGINGKLVKAEDSAKEITSFWYYLKKKVKGVFGIKPKQFNDTQNSEIQQKKEPQNIGEREYKQIKVEKAVSQQDEIMDSILQNLGQIKKYGKDLGNEIDKQNKIIARIDPQMDKAINKMGKVNKILKKELQS